MAGRGCLINSVITSMFIHSFMIYKWPKNLLADLNSKIRNFLWTGSIDKRKLITASWNDCCVPIKEGGLGIKNLSSLNKALLRKLTWKIMTSDSFVFTFFRDRFSRHTNRGFYTYAPSSFWPGIGPQYFSLLGECRWLIGCHSKVRFWKDNWLGVLICDLLHSPVENWDPDLLVSDLLTTNGNWNLPPIFRDRFPTLTYHIENIVVGDNMNDTLVWTYTPSGHVSCKDSYNYFNPVAHPSPWAKHIWAPSSHHLAHCYYGGFLNTEFQRTIFYKLRVSNFPLAVLYVVLALRQFLIFLCTAPMLKPYGTLLLLLSDLHLIFQEISCTFSPPQCINLSACKSLIFGRLLSSLFFQRFGMLEIQPSLRGNQFKLKDPLSSSCAQFVKLIELNQVVWQTLLMTCCFFGALELKGSLQKPLALHLSFGFLRLLVGLKLIRMVLQMDVRDKLVVVGFFEPIEGFLKVALQFLLGFVMHMKLKSLQLLMQWNMLIFLDGIIYGLNLILLMLLS